MAHEIMSKIMYYFSTSNRRLQHGDNRPIVCGETHAVDTAQRRLELCAYGLHASSTPFQALAHAPGPILWQVRLGGEVITGDDKSCASMRTYLGQFDATDVLYAFARRQALINIEKIRPYCAPADYGLILAWLTTGNDSLRSAAYATARSAAYAARSAAYAAARSAAYAAAESAAYAAAYTARSTTTAAAESAAYTARSTTTAAASAMLNEMIREATGWEV